MPKAMPKDSMLAPLQLPTSLKEKIFRAAERERLSVAEWSRRTFAKKIGYKFKKGE